MTVAEWKSRLGEVQMYRLEDLRKSLSGDYPSLNRAFIWRTTPQGHAYWSSRYRGQERMSRDDRAFMLALLIRGEK